MPEFRLFPSPLEVVKKLGHLLCDHIRYENPSDHRGGGPLLDSQLYDHYKEAYASYDDGATSPSTYGSLFEDGQRED